MYDFHCHLNHPDIFPLWPQYWSSFVEIGGKGLIIPSVDPVYNEATQKIATDPTRSSHIFGCFGFHPSRIGQTVDNYIYEERVKYQDIVGSSLSEGKSFWKGVGECGIDYFYPSSHGTEFKQRKRFLMQIAYAQKHSFPVVVHSRASFSDTYDIVSDFPNVQFYFHCWTYGPEETEKMYTRFPSAVFGCTGIFTYPKADDVRTSFNILPVSAVVCETDSPYLSPQPVRGQSNSPVFLPYIVDAYCKYKCIDRQDFLSLQQLIRNRLRQIV